ncbi:uncharacterized protein LOC127471450 [Manacus candei]|uniref:uncharacterized protein LOC127471450 n=1 Tax=Manacus candei TaxID=415023 RepID=UPI002225C5ED|nr:uncharacterized protein LOC127471450 [Manacus candei]
MAQRCPKVCGLGQRRPGQGCGDGEAPLGNTRAGTAVPRRDGLGKVAERCVSRVAPTPGHGRDSSHERCPSNPALISSPPRTINPSSLPAEPYRAAQAGAEPLKLTITQRIIAGSPVPPEIMKMIMTKIHVLELVVIHGCCDQTYKGCLSHEETQNSKPTGTLSAPQPMGSPVQGGGVVGYQWEKSSLQAFPCLFIIFGKKSSFS